MPHVSFYTLRGCRKTSAMKRVNRKLRKVFNERQDERNDYVDTVMFSMWTEIQTSAKYCPLDVTYGKQAVYYSEVREPTINEISLSLIMIKNHFLFVLAFIVLRELVELFEKIEQENHSLNSLI